MNLLDGNDARVLRIIASNVSTSSISAKLASYCNIEADTISACNLWVPNSNAVHRLGSTYFAPASTVAPGGSIMFPDGMIAAVPTQYFDNDFTEGCNAVMGQALYTIQGLHKMKLYEDTGPAGELVPALQYDRELIDSNGKIDWELIKNAPHFASASGLGVLGAGVGVMAVAGGAGLFWLYRQLDQAEQAARQVNVVRPNVNTNMPEAGRGFMQSMRSMFSSGRTDGAVSGRAVNMNTNAVFDRY